MKERKFSNVEGFCPVQRSLEVIGTPWKFLVINSLVNNPKMRFSELRDAISGISEKMLSQTLKQLEEDELVIREEAKTGPIKVEYSLTQTAKELGPILDSLRDWGNKYLNETELNK